MTNYRKSDQEYIDAYDRQTITILKELEKAPKDEIYCSKDLENIQGSEKGIPGLLWGDPLSKYIPLSPFFETGISRAQMKESSIILSKRADEEKDRLVMNTRVPQNIKCKKCNTEMALETHLFKENDTLLLFIFSCPKHHPPKRAIYPDGRREWTFPVKSCEKCGSEIYSNSNRKINTLTFTDTCSGCGDVITDEYDLDPHETINEEERKKYCIDWEKRKSFDEHLEEIVDFMELMNRNNKEKEIKELYETDKIEKVNVPKLEERLAKLSGELGYTKFKFDNHSTEKYLSVSFSAQDPTDREERESIKKLTILLENNLLVTNWRLMTYGIRYQLGLLTGKLRAYQDDVGLLKIAKEIHEAKKQK